MTKQTQKLNKRPVHKDAGHRKRLRDRFLANGLDGFHDYEVIELLLTLNTPQKDCKPAAKALLKEFQSLQAVLEAPVEELCRVSGVGPVNSMGIRLVKAASERYLKSRVVREDVVSNPADLIAYLRQVIGHKTKEMFLAVFLDAKNRVITSRVLFEGTLTSSSVYPREVLASALQYNAAAVIFAHNHPSGDATPSDSDIRITRKLCFALKYAGITVHEHMIVGRTDHTYSFAAKGLISEFNQAFMQECEADS